MRGTPFLVLLRYVFIAYINKLFFFKVIEK